MSAFADVLGDSAAMSAVRAEALRLLGRLRGGRRMPPVLIEGETGTGKSLLARVLHAGGPRASGPFVVVNCAAIPETLLESELFGYERGAFTDARQAKPGLFRAAHRGTLFLDEIGLLPEALQGKVLTAVEAREVRRLGAVRAEPADAWIVAATSADLPGAVAAGTFRSDLYHRLRVVTLAMPPLRARGEDVVLLAERLLVRAAAEYGLPRLTLDDAARRALRGYEWPGNVRELANRIERAVLLSDTSRVTPEALGLRGSSAAVAETPGRPRLTPAAHVGEGARLRAALDAAGGNVVRAAARAGLPRSTFRYRLRRLAGAAGDPPPASTPETAPRPASGRWERHHVAVVAFATDGPAPAAVQRLLERAATLGGHVEDVGVAGGLVVFGIEPAEDVATTAALAALALGRAAEAEIQEERAHGVRISVHATGMLARRTDDALQLDRDDKRAAVGVLDAVLAAGAPIAVSAAAARQLRRRFVLAPLGDAAGAFRLLGLAPAHDDSAPPLVGRHDELALLRGRLAAAVAGQGHAVALVGDPGIGKSRLVMEVARGARRLGVVVAEAHADRFGTSVPYGVAAQLLRQVAAIPERASATEAVARLHAVAGDLAGEVPFVVHALGVDDAGGETDQLAPEALRARTATALVRILVQASARQPLLLVVEDLQWIDRSSEVVLERVAGHVRSERLLLIATARPGGVRPWLDTGGVTRLSLAPLGDAESRVLAAAVAPSLGEAAARAIAARAEGHPLFVEELALAAQEAGADAAVAVPDTIASVLSARLHRLDAGSRSLLARAALLGREFTGALLEPLAEAPSAPLLEELVRRDFLVAIPGSRPPVYRFRHALIQEVAEAALPAGERQACHLAAARALEASLDTDPAGVAADLAHHYARSGDSDAAIRHLEALAQRALRRFANAEAIIALELALSHAGRVADGERRRLGLALALADSLSVVGRFRQIFEVLEPLAGAVSALGDGRTASRYHFRLALTHLFLGQHAPAVPLAERALALARETGDPILVGRAHYALAAAALLPGDAATAVAHSREALARLQGRTELHWIGVAWWTLAEAFIISGALDDALDAAAQLAAVGAEARYPRLQSLAASTTARACALAGDVERAQQCAAQALIGAPEPVTGAMAGWSLGVAHLAGARLEEARATLEQTLAAFRQIGMTQAQARVLVELSEACRRSGDADTAAARAAEALAIADSQGFGYERTLAERALSRSRSA
ncbi:MAG TPA: sigma 54-interacting transcriptional regulator [Terriglobales bacterium]|nr:sigma 54-interacting transcriptional regulator [Terriglobales bacterium]